ncbi:MAG TPA: hypothetical protein VNH18_24725 [Bryobacteraceae bacterium]|nr:hypothetical protein [Bryobacteraceae bacterium]
MDHSVNIDELQRVVTKYVDQYHLLVAAGPVTAASVLKVFTKNKAVNVAIVGGGAWFAVQELAKPVLALISDQFGYLQSLFAAFNG